MSRGGTRKSQAAQAVLRRARQRKDKVGSHPQQKANRKKEKVPKGRAPLVHLSGSLAPLILALSLFRSGMATSAEPADGYWLGNLVTDPDASYFREPLGLAYAGIVFAIAAAVFVIVPIRLWRRVNRAQPTLTTDRTAIDSSFTLAVLIFTVWIYRIVVGYDDGISSLAVVLLIMSAYVPAFSALMALMMPVVPGSGRIGGILPGFLRIPFTKRYLLTEEELDTFRLFAEAKESSTVE
jgi:hypothetical protein